MSILEEQGAEENKYKTPMPLTLHHQMMKMANSDIIDLRLAKGGRQSMVPRARVLD